MWLVAAHWNYEKKMAVSPGSHQAWKWVTGSKDFHLVGSCRGWEQTMNLKLVAAHQCYEQMKHIEACQHKEHEMGFRLVATCTGWVQNMGWV